MIERQMIPLYERMGPSAYEITREVIPSPNVSHLKELSRDEIRQVQRAIRILVSIPNLFRHFLTTHVSGKYSWRIFSATRINSATYFLN
jgi:hypothetical protein